MTALHEEGSSQHKAHNEQKHCQEWIQCVRYRTPNCSYHHLLCLHACNPPIPEQLYSEYFMNESKYEAIIRKKDAAADSWAQERSQGEKGSKQAKRWAHPIKITRSLRSPKGPGIVKKRDYHVERGTPRNTRAERCWVLQNKTKSLTKTPLSLSLSPSAPWPQSVHSWRQKATTQWDNHG
jgi:hypothetical protein